MPTETITLYYREGNSDKVYQVSIVDKDGGFVVNFAFGRRGSTLQSGTKTASPVPYRDAMKIFDKLVREKTAKGYTPGRNGTPYAHTESEQRSTGILPQLLNPIDEAQVDNLLASSTYLMQEKKDGRRFIIQAGEKIVASNRKGLTIGLPEPITQSASEIGLPCTLDGEAIGDTFHAFDLLELNGENYRASPCCERFETLRSLLKKSTAAIKLVPAYYSPEIKRAEFALLKQAHAEGVVFKQYNSPYTSGRPSSGGSQLKFKFVATGTFIVAGVNGNRRSVGLDALDEAGKTVFVGNVTISTRLKIPSKGALVEIRYLYAFPEGCLYQPVYLGERDDVERAACSVKQLKYKPVEEDDDHVEESTGG